MVVTIYYAETCPFSKDALKFLDKNKIKYKKHDINIFKKSKVVNELVKNGFLNKKYLESKITIPIIFINNEYIGGYTDLLKRFK